MAYNYEYPYTDMTRVNSDWLLNTVKELVNQMDNFTSHNTIKVHDPILWDYDTTYESNTIVIDSQGIGYLSIANVPGGKYLLTNTDFWQIILPSVAIESVQHANNADNAINAQHATSADTATSATFAETAQAASRANTANTATSATNATNAVYANTATRVGHLLTITSGETTVTYDGSTNETIVVEGGGGIVFDWELIGSVIGDNESVSIDLSQYDEIYVYQYDYSNQIGLDRLLIKGQFSSTERYSNMGYFGSINVGGTIGYKNDAIRNVHFKVNNATVSSTMYVYGKRK